MENKFPIWFGFEESSSRLIFH